MAGQHPNDPPTQQAVIAVRIAFGVVLVGGLVLGYVGFGQMLGASRPPWDLLYYDLQLFVLGADPLQGMPDRLPITLQIARFAAPLVTVYAVVETARVLFAAEWGRLRARRARGHAIVCGQGPVAEMLVRRLELDGRRVIAVRATPSAAARRPRSRTVLGDARDPAVLRAGGLDRATALYACTEDSTVNTAIALAAARSRSDDTEPQSVYAAIRDPELCLTLQARYLGHPHPPGLRLDFFNIDDLAARELFGRVRLDPVEGRPPTILVVGTTAFGRAVVVEASRQWRLRADGGPTKPLQIIVADPTATVTLNELVQRYPFLTTVCDFTPHNSDLLTLLAGDEQSAHPDIAFICYDDEEVAMKTALTAERFWRGKPRSVVVRLDQLATFRGGRGREDGDDRLLYEISEGLRVFGVVRAACEPTLIGDDLVERLARAIHDRYLLARRDEGQTLDTNTSLVDWGDLPPELRESNREQARDIGRKLRAIGCTLIPRVRETSGNMFTDDEIERLAEMEHGRWVDEHRLTGWRYGEERDAARQLHPGMVDWNDLPDPLRRRDRTAVVELPAILADVGFQVIRTEPAGEATIGLDGP